MSMRSILFIFAILCFSTAAYAQDCAGLQEVHQRDGCYVEQAAKSYDNSICQKVESDALKSVCEQATSGAVSSHLVDAGDPEQCMKMSGLELRNCISLIAVKNKDYTICNRLTQPEYLGTCLSGVAEKTGTTEPCKSIPADTAKLTCLVEVVSTVHSPKVCEETSAIVRELKKPDMDDVSRLFLDSLKSSCAARGVSIE